MVRSTAEVDSLAQQALARLEQELPIQAAFLFGSYHDGQPSDGSDIDLAVFTPAPPLRIADRARLQLQLQQQCAPDLELHLFPAEALHSARPTNFYGYLLQHSKRLR